MKKLSIIIPCYNDAQFIQQAVDSALGQTYTNKEIIVVDDGSDQETKRNLKDISPTIDKLITQENSGQANARNRGIAEAKGEFILVLDSDDFFEPTFCEKAIQKIHQNEDLKIVSCYTWLLFVDGSKKIYKPTGGAIDQFLFSNSAIGCSLFKKSDWETVGGYDEQMRAGFEDWEFFIRLLKTGGAAYILKEPLFYYRKRQNTTTARANKVKFEIWNYIFKKHSELYIDNFESYTDFLLNNLAGLEKKLQTQKKGKEFQLGAKILAPFRNIRKMLASNR